MLSGMEEPLRSSTPPVPAPRSAYRRNLLGALSWVVFLAAEGIIFTWLDSVESAVLMVLVSFAIMVVSSAAYCWWRLRRHHGRLATLIPVSVLALAAALVWCWESPPAWVIGVVVRHLLAPHPALALRHRWDFYAWTTTTSGRPGATAAFYSLIDDPDQRVRRFAATSVNVGSEDIPGGRDILRRRCDDDDPHVAGAAWLALCGSSEADADLIARLDPAHEQVLESRLGTLGARRIAHPQVQACVLAFADGESAVARRCAYRIVAENSPPLCSRPRLVAAIADHDPEIRATAVWWLGGHAMRSDLPVLLGSWGDVDIRVRRAAFAAVDHTIQMQPSLPQRDSEKPKWTSAQVQAALAAYASLPSATLAELIPILRHLVDAQAVRRCSLRMLPLARSLPPRPVPADSATEYKRKPKRERVLSALILHVYFDAGVVDTDYEQTVGGVQVQIADAPWLLERLAADLDAQTSSGQALS